MPNSAARAFDKSAPLAVALLEAGLSEEQIMQDNWRALMSLPQAAVDGIVASLGTLSIDHVVALAHSATLDVLNVKPSSPQSCEMWCHVVARFSVREASHVATWPPGRPAR
jgi:hypothetical protein